MRLLTRPPRIKVLEGIGAIGDGRITTLTNDKATVKSSMGDREYKVVLIREGDAVFRAYSNDNGTIYRGYVGYPIISFMMIKDILPLDREVMKAMTGVPWKELNEKYQKYAVVENLVLTRAEKMGVSRVVIDDYVNLVLKKLSLLKIYFDESLEKY
ncbi:MAG: hypothetical protein LM589_03680 [Thermosphaera sp.]|jgi:hypothetical protein|nr:hypothetical protein [Thermosphaera sp.]